MHSFAAIWPAQPDWREAALAGQGLNVRVMEGLSQYLVSGDVAAWAREAKFLESSIGGFALAKGDRYGVCLARDRILAVGPQQFATEPGWRPEGFAVTPISAGMLVFEITGLLLPDLIARATAFDPAKTSPSAAMSFAGALAIVYRHDNPETLRVHVDRPMGAYFWTWFTAVVQDILQAEGRTL